MMHGTRRLLVWTSLLISLLSCTRLSNSYKDDMLSCGAELPRNQEFFTVRSSGRTLTASEFEVLELPENRPYQKVTRNGCVMAPVSGRFLIRSLSTEEARVVAANEPAHRGEVELIDYSRDTLQILCEPDAIPSVSSRFSISDIVRAGIHENLTDAVQIEYSAPDSIPGIRLPLTEAVGMQPFALLKKEGTYDISISIVSKLRKQKLSKTCRYFLDLTPPLAILHVNSRQMDNYITLNGVKNILTADVNDSLTFHSPSADIGKIEYCVKRLDEDKPLWAAEIINKQCPVERLKTAYVNEPIFFDKKDGFQLVHFQAMDQVGNSAKFESAVVLLMHKAEIEQVKDLAISAVRAKKSMDVAEGALKAEHLRMLLPTSYERDLVRDSSLTALLKAYYQPGLALTLKDHFGAVSSIDLSDDGQSLVSVSNDRTIKLWRPMTGDLIYSIDSLSGFPESVSINSREQTMAVALSNNIEVRSLAGGQIRQRIPMEDFEEKPRFIPGTNVLASISKNMILLRDGQSGEVVKRLESKEGQWVAWNASSDGKRLMAASAGGQLSLWDVEAGSLLETWKASSQEITALQTDFENQKVYIGTVKGMVSVWNLSNRQFAGSWLGLTERVTGIVVNADHNLVAAASGSVVNVWDLRAGTLLKILSEHEAPITTILYNRNDESLVTASEDSWIKVWKLKAGRSLETWRGNLEGYTSLSVTQDGKKLVSGSFDGNVKVWDVSKSEVIHTLAGHTGYVFSVVISPDGKKVVSGSYDGTVRLWDLDSGRLEGVLDAQVPILSVSIDPNQRQIAAGVLDGTVRVWELQKLAEPRIIQAHSDLVSALMFDPRSGNLISGSADCSIKIWGQTSSDPLRVIQAHAAGVNSIKVTEDGQKLVSGSVDKSVRVTDLASGNRLNVTRGHYHEVTSLAIDENARKVISGSAERSLIIWDQETQENLVLLEHEEAAYSVAFSSQARKVFSGSWDKTIKVWEFDNAGIRTRLCELVKDAVDTKLCLGLRP